MRSWRLLRSRLLPRVWPVDAAAAVQDDTLAVRGDSLVTASRSSFGRSRKRKGCFKVGWSRV